MGTYGQSEYGQSVYGPDTQIIQGVGTQPYVTCQPWITADLLCCGGAAEEVDCEGAPSTPTYPFTDEEYIEAVSNILFNLTCQRFPGICTIKARPCIGCPTHPCKCGRYDAIKLPTDYRVWNINKVTIDGEIVPSSAYEVVGKNDLVRTDCDHWPACNNIVASDCDDCGSVLEVEFVTGVEPPMELRIAAADLVCELKKSCEGKDCALPERVTGITRRGVEMTFDDVGRVLSEGKTGIKSVDIALDVYGCSRRGGKFADPLALARGY